MSSPLPLAQCHHATHPLLRDGLCLRQRSALQSGAADDEPRQAASERTGKVVKPPAAVAPRTHAGRPHSLPPTGGGAACRCRPMSTTVLTLSSFASTSNTVCMHFIQHCTLTHSSISSYRHILHPAHPSRPALLACFCSRSYVLTTPPHHPSSDRLRPCAEIVLADIRCHLLCLSC